MSRRNRRIIVGLSGTAVIILGLWLTFHFIVLPMIIHSRLSSVLRRAGFNGVTFDVQHASPWETEIQSIAAGNEQQLRIGKITVEYSPLQALGGHVESLHIRDVRLTIPLDQITSAAHPTTQNAPQTGSGSPKELPVEQMALESGTLILQTGGGSVELPFSGTLARGQGPSAATVSAKVAVNSSPIDVSGTIDLSTASANVTASGAAIDLAPLAQLAPAGTRQTLGNVSGKINLNVQYQRQPSTNHLSSTITAEQITLAGEQFSDLALEFQVDDFRRIQLDKSLFTWGGGQIQTSPFKFNVNLDGQIDAVVWATHVDLQPILSRITQGRAKGSGKLSGRLPITVNWPRVLVSEGVLEAETAGTIQLGDATATFTDVLEKSDPRYGKQGPMASIKDRIVEAMRDFHYELLHAKFWVDPNGKTVVSLSLKGQGVSGQRQPLDIVLNLHGLEEGLNSYLAARSRVMDIGR